MTATRYLAAACLFATLAIVAVADRAPRDPLAGGDCADCHVSSGAVEASTARVLQASQERLCASCHPRAAVASHPTGVRPSMTAVADYPLDWKGELTCSSCHEIHGRHHGGLRGDKRHRDFCLACHRDSFFQRMADGGRSLAVSGHLDAVGLAGQPALLDPYTAQCMDCHGERGDAQVEVAGAANTRHRGSGINHPVGVDYLKASGYGGFRDRAALDRAIELPGGLVSCISCHSGYSGRHGAVVQVAARGRSLCLECHDL
ncbi:MAG: cytochrome c3 family protein [Rhodocyclaceae bacterium]|nr:cytochrome c3 family protein [Rhodocyclaceae bacterium]